MRPLGVTAVVALCAAIVVFVVVSALDDGGSSGGKHSIAGQPPYAAYFPRAPHVLSSASIYKLSSRPPPPRYAPLFHARFEPPIARYRAYSVAQLGVMERQLPALQRPSRPMTVRLPSRLGGPSTPAICTSGPCTWWGRWRCSTRKSTAPRAGCRGASRAPRFTGLHKIEYGLWTGAPPHTLAG